MPLAACKVLFTFQIHVGTILANKKPKCKCYCSSSEFFWASKKDVWGSSLLSAHNVRSGSSWSLVAWLLAKTKFSRRIPRENRTREKLSINKAFSSSPLNTHTQRLYSPHIFFHFLFSPESGMGNFLIVNSLSAHSWVLCELGLCVLRILGHFSIFS